MRLWDEASQRARRQQEEPEIRRIDISSAILQLYQWAEKPEDFPWFESPRAESILAAKSLLSQLGAIEDERITDLGRQMSQLAVSPRLARMLLESGGSPYRREICLLAALLSERDPFVRPRGEDRAPRGPGRHPSGAADGRCDMTQRLLALREYFAKSRSPRCRAASASSSCWPASAIIGAATPNSSRLSSSTRLESGAAAVSKFSYSE